MSGAQPAAADLGESRRTYAEELRGIARLRSERLVSAFARVPRERYLGPPPWLILTPQMKASSSSDPRDLYRDVLVSIDRRRRLNNGQPSGLAMWFDALEIAEGERVYHVGAGVGYYTAVLAEVVGPHGRVIAIEIDSGLAERAARNLGGFEHVEVKQADGTRFDPGPVDAVFVNAGANHILPLWVDLLAPGGRLLVPLTLAQDPHRMMGVMLGVTRGTEGYRARIASPVGIFPCSGAAEDNEADTALRQALEVLQPMSGQIRSLRREPHPLEPECWLHGRDLCVSTRAPGG